jgi:hypothetical protein
MILCMWKAFLEQHLRGGEDIQHLRHETELKSPYCGIRP